MALSARPALVLVFACSTVIGACANTTDGSSATTTASTGTTPQTTTAVLNMAEAPTGTTKADTGDMVPWIVYQSPAGLRLIAPDGTRSTTRAALPDGPDGFHPDWSPDGRMLVFVVEDPDGTRDIWTAKWDGTDPAVLVDCEAPCWDAETPAWSPDGTTIAFARIDNIDGRNPGSQIQIVDVATGEIRTVAATEGAEYAGAPRWAASGLALVVEVTRFIDDGNDTSETTGRTIAVIDMTESPTTIRPLMPLDTYSSYPDWHPTQDLILFLSGAPDPLDPSLPPQNLFTIKPDGSDLVQITNQGPTDDGFAMPTFRRDGDGIFANLVHRPAGNLTLVSLAIDGTGLTELGGSASIPGAHPRQRPLELRP